MRVRYSSLEFPGFDLHLRTLWDDQQFSDEGGQAAALGISSAAWPLFGVLWGAGRILARLMVDRDVEGLRVLEVGCGMGLASLVLNHRLADITATDHHPEAEDFLAANAALNGDAPIPFVRTGWADADAGLGCFDLIVGADLLYEAPHIAALSGFLHTHLSPGGDVVLVDPGRGLHARFSRRMVELGYEHRQREPEGPERCDDAPRARILSYHRPG
jgi:predicted nicotinamide N-methyase